MSVNLTFSPNPIYSVTISSFFNDPIVRERRGMSSRGRNIVNLFLGFSKKDQRVLAPCDAYFSGQVQGFSLLR